MFHGLLIIKRAQGEKFTVFLCTENILVFKINDNSELDIPDLKEMQSFVNQFSIKNENKNLIIAGKFSTISPEAKHFIQTDEINLNAFIAQAIIVHSLAQRIVGNFYLGIISSKRPSRLFTSIDLAIEWLKSKD